MPAAPAPRVVAVFGGTGFLGRHITARLAAEGAEVRVAVRRPERAPALEDDAAGGRITAIRADVWDEATVAPAVAGADAVVNTVGHYVERSGASFDAIHGQGARHVARAASAAGVRRLVHISGLGTAQESPSPYVRARAKGEALVREAFPAVTILRPSVVFGPGDAFFNRLAGLARAMPVLPLFGTGDVEMQPVYVGDIAEAVARALSTPETAGKTYELGGPRVYTYREILKLVLARTGRRRLLIPVPYAAWEVIAGVMSVLPSPPVSRDQITLMRRDNVVAPDALTLEDLGVTPTAAEAVLPEYLG